MFGSAEVSYHQTYPARVWLSILRTPYPTQNLQRKHRTIPVRTTFFLKITLGFETCRIHKNLNINLEKVTLLVYIV